MGNLLRVKWRHEHGGGGEMAERRAAIERGHGNGIVRSSGHRKLDGQRQTQVARARRCPESERRLAPKKAEAVLLN
jgi:hypothetical protein